MIGLADGGGAFRALGSLIVVGLPVLFILVWVFLDLAMWVLFPDSMGRLLTIAIFGLLCSPTIEIWMVLGVPTLYLMLPPPPTDLLISFFRADAISLPFRAAIVIWLWIKAVRRLETVAEPREPILLAERVNTLLAPCQQLVRIALVSGGYAIGGGSRYGLSNSSSHALWALSISRASAPSSAASSLGLSCDGKNSASRWTSVRWRR